MPLLKVRSRRTGMRGEHTDRVLEAVAIELRGQGLLHEFQKAGPQHKNKEVLRTDKTPAGRATGQS